MPKADSIPSAKNPSNSVNHDWNRNNSVKNAIMAVNEAKNSTTNNKILIFEICFSPRKNYLQ